MARPIPDASKRCCCKKFAAVAMPQPAPTATMGKYSWYGSALEGCSGNGRRESKVLNRQPARVSACERWPSSHAPNDPKNHQPRQRSQKNHGGQV